MSGGAELSVRKLVVAGFAAISVGVLGVGAWYLSPNSDAGKHSAFSRTQLVENWPKSDEFPILVPRNMPPGAAEAAEVGFELSNVVVDPQHSPRERVWVSYYNSDVLGGIGTAFRIFQRPRESSGYTSCGAGQDETHLVREVENATITVCSAALMDGSLAYEYWESVVFTSELGEVAWLNP